MAEGYEPRPADYDGKTIVFNNLISSSTSCFIKTYGNVVFVSGNITFSNSFPIDWNYNVIATDVPKGNGNPCGLVRFDDISIPPAVVIAGANGLCVSSRNTNIQGKQGLFFGTYIAPDA